ncbi:Hemopexin/matrixin [Penicillium griseofulvum]|uniref:Hemopexin/matrixin n=1 Tax=Penicillium patulum TaxID=5078 RepID=A0A135LVL9_PENPA|nr:Hemopexin/matrixin [Penicillium griseofulvum]KXG52979.1 Hemopexin/matrixin [Penicillium griseofulvum]
MVDAACRIPGKEEICIFSGRHYGRVKFGHEGPEHDLAAGPTLLSKGWNTLPKMGFGTVDTVVPVPGHENQLYVFFGGRYAKIKLENYDDGFANDGALPISSGWKSLVQAGFDTVDAAMLTPGTKNDMYFFNGLNYVRLDNSTDKMVNKVAPIAQGWPSLVQAGFDCVDAIVPSPTGHDHYYVFRGDQFAVIKVDNNRRDTLVSPPKSISSAWKALDSWV